MEKEKIAVLSGDMGLIKELQDMFQRTQVLVLPDHSNARPLDASFIFIDIDTVGIERIREYSGEAFVVAVTGQERTGPVMEAVTAGAYEIVRRPLKKERIARILQDLHDLRKELAHPIPISKDQIAPAATCAIVGSSALVMDLV